MHRIAVTVRACIMSIVIGSGMCGETQGQPQRRGLPAPTDISVPADAVEVPMHRYEGLPIVEVTVNGKGPYRLVVDTGASGVLLRQDLAETLELPSPPGMPAGGVRVQVRSPGGPVPATLLYIEDLRIDAFRVGGIWTIATELPFGDAIDGVIGMNCFRAGLLTLDYPRGVFVIRRGTLPDVNQRDVFAYTTPQDSGVHPTIEVSVDGAPTDFLVDTGLRSWFAVSPAWAEAHEIIAGPVDDRKGLAVGGTVRWQLARFSNTFSLGRYSVRHPVAQIQAGEASVPTGNIIGSGLLEHFVVTMDGTLNRMQLADGPDTPLTPPPTRSLGVSVKQVGQALEIWAVHPASHAETLGLVEGDRIEAFDGRPAVDLYRSPEWPALLRTANSVKVTYAQAGGGPARDVAVRVLEQVPDVP